MDAQARHEDFYYSEPVLDEEFVFFHRRDQEFDWQDFSDLEEFTLGGVIGYSYGPGLNEAIESGLVTMEWVRDDEANFRKLLAGRIDAYPQEVNVGQYFQRKLLTEQEMTELTHHPQPLLVNQSYLLLPRSQQQSKELLALFNTQLQRFKEDGRYQAYFDDFERGMYTPLTVD